MSIFLKKEMHFDFEHLNKAEELVCSNKYSCRTIVKDLRRKLVDGLAHCSLKCLLLGFVLIQFSEFYQTCYL